MFGALKRGRFRSLASLILVVNVVGELQQKRTLAASRGFPAAARLSCTIIWRYTNSTILLLLLLLNDIAGKQLGLLRSMLLFALSACLSRSCIVFKRRKISTRFLLHTTAPCLSQIVSEFGYIGLALSLQILTHPIDLSVEDIRWQIAAEWFARVLHTRTAVARLPQRKIGFLVSYDYAINRQF